MAQMTKRERVMRAMNLQETDRVPVYDILQNDDLIEHITGQAPSVDDGAQLKGETIARCFDMTRMPDGPSRSEVVRREDGIVIQQERWTLWIIERPWSDRAGLLEWIKREIDRLDETAYDRAYAQEWYARMDRFQGYFGDDTVQVIESGVGLTEMYWAVGWEEFSYLLADEPDLIVAWLDARNRAELRRVASIGDPTRIPVALTYDDLAYKNSLLISPKWLREHWFPRLTRLNAAWHERGAKCLFHSDGRLWPILDDLVAAGIDGLNPIEVAAGMTVAEARERYPGLFLTGGVDVSYVLPRGTVEEVRAACRENIAATGGVGYFVGSSTELDWNIPAANIMAMLESAWETA